MEKNEIRCVIKYYNLRGKTGAQIKTKLDRHLGESAPSYSTVKEWVAAFKRGRESCEDEHRSGRPNEVTNPDLIKKIRKIVYGDRRLKVREIVDIVGVSYNTVWKILHNHLHCNKLCARWVPRLLSDEQKFNRAEVSAANLARFKRSPQDFMRRFITVDETWVHHYTPETKQQSKMWTSPGESAPKKAKSVLSAGKVMATVFWDARGIIYIDYLEKGRTINGPYYAALLQRLKEEVALKRPHLAKKKILFHQDNAPAHTSAIAMAKIHELHYELVDHPPYSPDLAPCDFHLFPNLKKWLGGKKFASNDEVIASVNEYFEDQDASFYSRGIAALEHRWAKCVELEGDYVEK